MFLTADGRVKILDFGLAKLTEPAAGEHRRIDATALPRHRPRHGDRHGRLHVAGAGASGQPVDHRSDIFSFGCVLYEMVTGRRAFKRDTAAETMTAILRDEPPT